MITNTVPNSSGMHVQALNNDHTLLDLVRDRTDSWENALFLESALDLSGRRPGQDEAW